MIDVEFEDNSKEVLEALEKAKQKALIAIGFTAEKHAKENETAIDTGRLRNSIAFATKGKSSKTTRYNSKTGGESESYVFTNDADAVYIGTNVDYATYIENGSRNNQALHFLQKACTEHDSEYKRLTKQALEAVDK